MKKIIVSVVVIASLGNVALAGVIDVVNHSFEAQQGTWNHAPLPGWVESSGFTSRGNFKPTTFYPGSFYKDRTFLALSLATLLTTPLILPQMRRLLDLAKHLRSVLVEKQAGRLYILILTMFVLTERSFQNQFPPL